MARNIRFQGKLYSIENLANKIIVKQKQKLKEIIDWWVWCVKILSIKKIPQNSDESCWKDYIDFRGQIKYLINKLFFEMADKGHPAYLLFVEPKVGIKLLKGNDIVAELKMQEELKHHRRHKLTKTRTEQLSNASNISTENKEELKRTSKTHEKISLAAIGRIVISKQISTPDKRKYLGDAGINI